MRVAFALLFFITFGLAPLAAADPITTGSLIDEMTNMRRLGDFPDPAYKTIQFSSYDHRSALPGGPGWFENSDGFGKEPIPNFEAVLKAPEKEGEFGEYLVCDVQGPGAIVRVWTARIEGAIKVYLDNNDTPLFDGPADEFFLHPYSRFLEGSGLDESVLANTFYQRNAAYCPIPFAQRCRVIWTGDPQRIHFYQLQVRVFDPAANVITFTPADLKTYADNIRKGAAILSAPDANWKYAATTQPAKLEASVEPGKKVQSLELDGPAALERLTLSVEAADRDLALRQTVLHIAFDEFPSAQVQAPIGDFFGAAPGVNPYVSIPFTVAPEGTMSCRYVMPFEKKCRIAFENLGEQPVTVRGEALAAPYAWNPDRSMHFRARWRINHDMKTDNAAPEDLPFILAQGQGVYVGTVSYVLNTNEVPTPGGNWWGEGDEKIFVDADVRPSTFGTGSEDYYNYAWSAFDIFQFPYCAQPRDDGPANRGFVTNNRWHILDPLPFRNRLAFYMEFFTHEVNTGMAYGRIGYYYGRPGVVDDHETITREDVRKQVLPPGWMPAARGGAKRSSFIQMEDCVKSPVTSAMEEGNLWAKGSLYRWQPKTVGEELTLAFNIPIKKKYVVQLAMALDPASGRVSVRIDDAPAEMGGEQGVLNLNDPCRTLLRSFGIKPKTFDAGDHTITLRYEGGPAENLPGSIGLDFLWLQLH